MSDDDTPVLHLMSAAASTPALVRYLNVELIVTIRVCATGAMLSLFTNVIYGLIFTALALLFCRVLTMSDNSAFRQLGLWVKTRVIHLNRNWQFWNASVYTSNKSRF